MERPVSTSDLGDRTLDRPSEGAVEPPDPRRWRALAVLGTAFFMVILDSTIVLTAVPSMQDQLNLSVAGVQWVLTGYAVAFGGLMLFFGRVADLVGRRSVFLAGTALFVVASLVCGLAWSGEVLIAARVVQGISAAIMAPTALSIVISVFRNPAERNRALGIWGALGGIGATAGLLLGGVITSSLGWQWIFYVNVPIGLGIFLAVRALVDQSRERPAVRRFDVAGALTITAALILLIYAVVNAPAAGWGSAVTIIQLAGAGLLIVLFVVIESRSAAPLVPPRLFRIRTLAIGNLLILAAGLTVDGALFLLTLYVQQVLGHSPLQFGLTSAIMTVMSIVGAFAGQAAVTRFGLRPIAVGALLLMAVATAVLASVTALGAYGNVYWALLMFGLGMGAAFVASQIAALQGVAESESGVAAGLVDTAFNIGGALGIAIVTSVATSVAQASNSADPGEAMTGGLQVALLVVLLFAVLGLLTAFFLPGTRRSSAIGSPRADREQ